MKSQLLSLILLSLVLVSCRGSSEEPVEDDANSPTSAQVELATEEEPEALPNMPLEASFMSDHETFSYSFMYNGNLLKLLDSSLPGASTYGPSFKVEGGAEVTGYTVWASELESFPGTTATQLLGDYEVLRTSMTEGNCTLEKGAVRHLEEGLVLQVRICPEDDAFRGQEAFESLFKGLRIQKI